jgi:hypothetical protein
MDEFRDLTKRISDKAMLDLCCEFLTLCIERPSKEQRDLLIAKFEQDARFESLRTQVNLAATEHYWPFMRAKNFVNYTEKYRGRLNHKTAIDILAKRAGITIDQLLLMNPIAYAEKYMSLTGYLSNHSLFKNTYYKLSLQLFDDEVRSGVRKLAPLH